MNHNGNNQPAVNLILGMIAVIVSCTFTVICLWFPEAVKAYLLGIANGR